MPLALVARLAGFSFLRFFDTEYAIPATMLKDKKRVTVRFEATDGNETAAIYGIRMIRTNSQR